MAPKTKKSNPMKRWHVSATVVAGTYLGEYEAATKEDAEEMALNERGLQVSVCHQCSGRLSDPEIDPESVRAEEDS